MTVGRRLAIFGVWTNRFPDYSQCQPSSNTLTTSVTTPKATTTAKTTSAATSPAVTNAAGNIFSGKQIYANPYYASEISASAIPSLTGTLKTKATAVSEVGSFVWL